MSTISPLEHEDGGGWAVASALITSERDTTPAHVLVPIDRIPELSATELGHAVRSLAVIAQRCHAEELARQILQLSLSPSCTPSKSLVAALADATLWLREAAPVSPLAREALRSIGQIAPTAAADDIDSTRFARLLHGHAAVDALFVAVGQRDGFCCSVCAAPTDLHVWLSYPDLPHDDTACLLCARCLIRRAHS